ncbi:MAG: hypothetical protein MJ070_06480 [Lachnospiraceae bacterium]|nr:hypothetical protein [Lachnospiraceae bacterium]
MTVDDLQNKPPKVFYRLILSLLRAFVKKNPKSRTGFSKKVPKISEFFCTKYLTGEKERDIMAQYKEAE